LLFRIFALELLVRAAHGPGIAWADWWDPPQQAANFGTGGCGSIEADDQPRADADGRHAGLSDSGRAGQFPKACECTGIMSDIDNLDWIEMNDMSANVADAYRNRFPTDPVFTKTDKGGVQQVIAKDSAQGEQIGLIREHLSKIAHEFAQGDFSDPTRIHGETMPGLAELKAAKPGAIRIEYRELAAGAQIGYATDAPGLVDAIHRWFDAQLSDHARHAVAGHPHHLMHGR
jgi:hypothetical protein